MQTFQAVGYLFRYSITDQGCQLVQRLLEVEENYIQHDNIVPNVQPLLSLKLGGKLRSEIDFTKRSEANKGLSSSVERQSFDTDPASSTTLLKMVDNFETNQRFPSSSDNITEQPVTTAVDSVSLSSSDDSFSEDFAYLEKAFIPKSRSFDKKIVNKNDEGSQKPLEPRTSHSVTEPETSQSSPVSSG